MSRHILFTTANLCIVLFVLANSSKGNAVSEELYDNMNLRNDYGIDEQAIQDEQQSQVEHSHRLAKILALLNEYKDESDDISNNKRDNSNSNNKNTQQRLIELRRQLARWDVGFGKRASAKTKSFMDALYGKRSGQANARQQLTNTWYNTEEVK